MELSSQCVSLSGRTPASLDFERLPPLETWDLPEFSTRLDRIATFECALGPFSDHVQTKVAQCMTVGIELWGGARACVSEEEARTDRNRGYSRQADI